MQFTIFLKILFVLKVAIGTLMTDILAPSIVARDRYLICVCLCVLYFNFKQLFIMSARTSSVSPGDADTIQHAARRRSHLPRRVWRERA